MAKKDIFERTSIAEVSLAKILEGKGDDIFLKGNLSIYEGCNQSCFFWLTWMVTMTSITLCISYINTLDLAVIVFWDVKPWN